MDARQRVPIHVVGQKIGRIVKALDRMARGVAFGSLKDSVFCFRQDAWRAR